MLHGKNTQRIEGTLRVEAFSDAVLAIIMTLLIIEVHPPHLADATFAAFVAGMEEVLPSIVAFTFSFLVLSVFWVNHHYFLHQLSATDWPLLWQNLLLLFWLAIVPFTTAFLGDHPSSPHVIALYCIDLALAALSFVMMARHAYIHSNLHAKDIPLPERQRASIRAIYGAIGYTVAAAAAFWSVEVAWALLLIVPLMYVIPRTMRGNA